MIKIIHYRIRFFFFEDKKKGTSGFESQMNLTIFSVNRNKKILIIAGIIFLIILMIIGIDISKRTSFPGEGILQEGITPADNPPELKENNSIPYYLAKQ